MNIKEQYVEAGKKRNNKRSGARPHNSISLLMEEYSVTRFVEVGLYKCKAAKYILRRYDHLLDEYWGIDFFLEQDWSKKRGLYQKEWDDLYGWASYFSMFFKSFKVLRMSSKEAADLFKKRAEFSNWKPFDMVYIDAAHDYNSLTEDIKLWIGFIKPGGVISGHDYGQRRHKEAKIAVDDYFGEENIKTLPGYVWYYEV